MIEQKAIIDSDSYRTPQPLFNALNDIYDFEYDLCADAENTKCQKFFSKENSILNQKEVNGSCFCNPPYSKGNLASIVKHLAYLTENERFFCLGLLPVDTSTKWYHTYISNRFCHIFKEGRIKFDGGKTSARFANMFVLFQKDRPDSYNVTKLIKVAGKKF